MIKKCTCGSDPSLKTEITGWGVDRTSFYWFKCPNCGARSSVRDSRAEAIQRWNDTVDFMKNQGDKK